MELGFILVGVAIGLTIASIIFLVICRGVLKVRRDDDLSDPYLFLELGMPPNKLYKKKYIVLKVDIPRDRA